MDAGAGSEAVVAELVYTVDTGEKPVDEPRMQPAEAVVFKVFDSERDGRARFTPHTAFEEPGSPAGAPHRQSIEARLFVFFG